MIERLYVQNYRCLESFTLDLTGKPSVLLIGRNGTGKSTVRHALTILQSIARGTGRVDTLITPTDYSFYDQYLDQQGRFRGTDRPMRFEINLTLNGRKFDYGIAFDWPANFREARILQESLTVDAEPVFRREFSQVSLPGSNPFGLDWHVFALTVINERGPGSSIQEFKAFLASLVLIEPNPARIDGFSESPSDRLKTSAENFAACLRALIEKRPSAYVAIETYLRTVFPDFSSFDHEDRGKVGKQLMITFKRAAEESFRLEFDALSAGEKCFFLCAYFLAANSVGLPVYCFWDEPDSHLSLAEAGQFVTSLRKMAKRSGQFIATSHHPESIRKFSSDTTYVLTRKSHLDPTLPKLLKDFNYHGDLIDSLIRDEVIG